MSEDAERFTEIKELLDVIESRYNDLLEYNDTTAGLWATDHIDLMTKEDRIKFHMFELK